MKSLSLFAGVAAVVLSTMAFADGHEEVNPAVKARQSHMQLYAHNLGILGGMAQGKVDYDAEAAAAAASNLSTLVTLDQSSYWPAGTDNATIEGTKALPSIWTDFDGVMEASAGMGEAVAAMDVVAGTDLASLQGAMQALGGACSACHREYRQRDE